MNILVTGSDGYIGIRLVQLLLEQGFNVTGLDTGFYRSGWLFNSVSQLPHLISKDTRQVTEEDLKGFDAIVHLAELSNDPLGQNDPELTYEINHRATVQLAKKAKRAGIKRFVYYSSCSVYGASDEIRDETSPIHPLTAYAECKALNEKALSQLADDEFSPTVLRNATAFGPSPRMRFDIAVNNLAGLAFTLGQIKMDSDGTPWRPFVHLDDISQATLCVLKAPREIVHNQIFNTGDSHSNYQIKEIADMISGVFPKCSISLNNNASDKRNYKVNFDKITSLLPGFKCKKNVHIGIQELYSIFKKIDLQKEVFESRHYTRLKQIQYLLKTNQIDEHFFWNK